MIKAHFLEGIGSPVNCAILDDRLKVRKYKLLRIIQGNISYKLIFKIYPKYSISLRDKNINKTLTLSRDFKYFDIIHDGSYPYSITYAIEYALTNSINNEMFGKTLSFKILREINLPEEWEVDLSNQPTLTRGSTPKTIEYTLEGKIILGNRRLFSVPKKELELHGIQNFTRYTQLIIPPSNEILATIRRNNQNLKIKIDYNNRKLWHQTFAIPDIGAAKSYVDAKMIKYLERKILIEPHS